MKRVFAVAVLALCPSLFLHAQRLPNTVIPSSYDLTFAPDLATATFTGEETIHVRVAAPSAAIVLNASELKIDEATVGEQKATVTLDEAKEQATLTLPAAVPAGETEIHLRFTGVLNDKLRGFYLSKSKRRNYAVTQFEATDARKAFPGFDEPSYKAVFHVTLVVDKGDTAISNGSIVSDTPGPGEGKHTLKFSASPKMSSYLLAMLVGDFVCREGGADGIPIRVCSLPEEKDMTGFALEASENVLKFYDRYFSVKYPYKKLDHIVFPDFAAGAMENAGAITYRDTALMIDPKTATYDQRQEVASVIAHEMAHQWFGDLVTMKWWNDIWLNEGFATWMSDKPLEAWKPEWKVDQQEIDGTLGALNTDQIASIRTIRAQADTPAEIQNLFDGIAYGKAASVLRMVEAYVGPETFRKGVNAYLEKHSYANATAEDFWSQIAETSGKPVDKIMKSFTEQPGAPLVDLSSHCEGGKTLVTLTQQRYFADEKLLAKGSDQLWTLPVALLPSASNQPEYVLLSQRQQKVELPGCSAWVYANAGGRGYYRSGYEAENFQRISAVAGNLSEAEQLRIPNDAWAMVRVGRMKIGDYLDLVKNMNGSLSRDVVEARTNQLFNIEDHYVSAADRPAFQSWVRGFIGPLLQQIGTTAQPGELAERSVLRANLTTTLAMIGRDPQLLAKARETAEQYMKDPTSVDREMASGSVVLSAQNGDAALFDRYHEQLGKAKTPQEYNLFLSALGVFPQPELTHRFFDLLLSPEVKNQAMFALFNPLSFYETQPVAWQLFKDDYPRIVEKIGGLMESNLPRVATVFCDAALSNDAQQFFASKNIPGAGRELKNAKERVDACIQVRELQQQNLTDYLQQHAAH
ncbi:MAG: M1 family metallopeptidase [Acidobacteriota bacterium]|nr:M1 family metallopeptidase [Acidobacteriota bacterium]